MAPRKKISESPRNIKSIIRISNLRGHALPELESRKFYVKLTIDGQTYETRGSERGRDPVWNETFSFEVDSASSLLLQVHSKHWLSHRLVGSMEESVASLVSNEKSIELVRTLTIRNSSGVNTQLQSSVGFSVTIEDSEFGMVSAKVAVEQAGQATKWMESGMKLEYIEHATSVVELIEPLAGSLKSLLSKVQLFNRIVDNLVEVHPYAKLAWGILSMTEKIILEQMERDQGILRLFSVMDDAFSFVNEAEPLRKIRSHNHIIVCLARQTTECGYFIRDYASNKSFWLKSLEHLISDADSKMKEYQKTFKTLKARLQERSVIYTEINVLRILGDVANIATNIDFLDMHYAKGAGYNPEKGCLPGTRETVIDEIVHWVNLPDGDDVPRMFWLNGVAGSGKSAIAHTIARQFDQQKRLGSSFCFDASKAEDRLPHHLFGTISLDLSDLDKCWKTSLWHVVGEKKALRTSVSVHSQFDSFMVKPSESIRSKTIGPILIVIDALDESGSPKYREGLLSILGNKISQLPPNFRILVTSRPEKDIQEALGNNPNVLCKRMDAIDLSVNTHDLDAFVWDQLSSIPLLDQCWPGGTWRKRLVEKAEGLFQWAVTACLFIKGNGESGLDPVEQFETLLSSTHGPTVNHLDSLYADVLGKLFPTDNLVRTERFRAVLGIILSAKEPLSVSALSKMCHNSGPSNAVELIIRPLGSLLSGVALQHEPVRPLHTSFRDFLTDPVRSGRYHVDLSLPKIELAVACLQILNSGLRFNICGLRSSHKRNEDVPNLDDAISENIPSELRYACRFWIDHLQSLDYEVHLYQCLRQILHEQLLYWLEVLSLLKMTDLASRSMLSVARWCTDKTNDYEDLASFAVDAHKFVVTFASVIAQSAPHIYISALPFAPKESKVSQMFLPLFPGTVTFRKGQATHWPTIENVIQGHTAPVVTVAFSPDGKRIASCSRDLSIRVWDTETGVLVSGLFEHNGGMVYSIAFSADGLRLVSGSADKQVRLWNAESGKMITRPFNEHRSPVFSVAYSSDDRYIASGSSGGHICIWEIETQTILNSGKRHSKAVYSVSFSNDGRLLASGSQDNTICVWDVQRGTLVFGPCGEHQHPVNSVVFSPDDRLLASGSRDRTVRLWDAHTGKPFAAPFEGHTRTVSSVTFSQDGQRVVSGSYDQTIRVWDVETGRVIAGPFEGHTGAVYSCSLSKDGKHIASGADDHTIRVWDAEAGRNIPDTWKYTSAVNSVAFSSDGSLVAWGSADQGIRIRNTNSDEIVAGPLKGHTGTILCLDFSPDGKTVASCSEDTKIIVWDIMSGKSVVDPITGHTKDINSVAFSPDGKFLVSGADDNSVRLWDASNGRSITDPVYHASQVFAVAFSPDGKNVASSSRDKKVSLWHLDNGERCIRYSDFEGHSSSIYCVTFSPDGRLLASGSRDSTIQVWDTETGAPFFDPLEAHTGSVLSVVFSSDGQRLASSSHDHTICVWDTRTGGIIAGPLQGHTSSVISIRFLQSPNTLISGSWDQAIRIWDLGTNSRRSEIARRPSGISSFNLSSRMENGWIVDPKSMLILWIPPWHRTGLKWPINSLVISKDLTILDFSQFKYGYSWAHCADHL